LLLAVSTKGIVGYEVLDHNCRKSDFICFVQALHIRPGTTLVMDNIAFHHSKDVADAAKIKGARILFTPPYSPRCNAIENVFGALKHEYRSHCPPSASDSFDYESLLLAMLESWPNL
jgi:transposase